MRTLALLTALLLLAFQAQAQTLQETADKGPAKDQPGAKDQDQLGAQDQDQLGAQDQDQLGAQDQDQLGAQDQDQLGAEDLNLLADEIQDLLEAEDVVNYITGEERPTQQASGRLRETLCKCQHAHCNFIRSVLKALGLQSKICGS